MQRIQWNIKKLHNLIKYYTTSIQKSQFYILENIRESLFDLRLGEDFLDVATKVQSVKEKKS